ncbi:aldehyde dehydrogenase family protein [Epibacterium ulvae]|uniref:aldehyde dehydrogenase family protein n=1 Tax=Epibacterium ulvae TaxID=1156985 RepID=UPI002491A3CD|nr:aldehyde dehydrogenase family protein [Epibacterium ulvae]
MKDLDVTRFTKKMYIAGELTEGETEIEVVNPATDLPVATVPAAGIGDADRALQAAKDAFPTWSKTSIAERQGWMHKLRDAVIENEDHLRDCIHYELGKPWGATEEDFNSLKDSLAFYAEEIARVSDTALPDRAGTHDHRLVHEPVGVALAYLAWNFPLLNLAFKIGPAMAAGCPIIIRPSEKTPISAYAVGELCHQIGLPAGVVQIFTSATTDVADHMTASDIPALVTLIGSTATGRHIMKTGATTIKSYSMELGGNAPALVFPDADLDLAISTLCGVKFAHAGQICVSPNRVFVHRDIYEDFKARAVAFANDTAIGWDKNAAIHTGPVVDEGARGRMLGLIADATEKGAELLAGGNRPEHLPTGSFLAPTVLTGITPQMGLYQQENFGPIISIIPFDEDTDLAAMANDCDDGGLTAYVFTSDLARAEHWAQILRYGEIQINGVKYDIDLPHGGIGQSGIGHDCSTLALDDYLIVKRVTRALGVS